MFTVFFTGNSGDDYKFTRIPKKRFMVDQKSCAKFSGSIWDRVLSKKYTSSGSSEKNNKKAL